MGEYTKLLKNLIYFLMGDFGSRIITFLMVPLYTGILSTAEYGEIDLLTSSVSLIVPLVTLNICEAVFRYVMNHKVDKKAVFSAGVIISGTGLVILSVFILLFGRKITNYSLYLYLMIIGSALYTLCSNYAKGMERVKIVSLVGLINTLSFVLMNIIFLVYFSLGVDGYLLSVIISNFLSVLILFVAFKLWREISVSSINGSLISMMLRYSLPLIPTNLCWWVIMISDRYMLSWMIGAEATGLYAVANKVPTILQAILTIFMQAWQVSSTSLYENKKEKIAEFFEKTLRFGEHFAFIACSVLIIFAQLIMLVIAKNEFFYGWTLSPFLLVSIAFSFVNGIITVIYQIYQQNIQQFYTVLVAAIFNIVMNILLIIGIGAVGVTIASALSYAIIMFSRLKNTEKFLKFDRNYSLLILNSIVIMAQAAMLIIINNLALRYMIQLVFLLTIMIINRKFIIDVKSIIMERVKRL